MAFRGTLCVDPQEPSTSSGPQRRSEENLLKFEAIFSTSPPFTLWEICTGRKRGQLTKTAYPAEIRSLRGLSFKTLLKDDEALLTDLSRISGITFNELCEALRFLAYFRKIPTFKTKNSDAIEFFKLVCNCIQYLNDRWINTINRNNLLNSITLETLKMRNTENVDAIKETTKKEEEEDPTATSSLSSQRTTPSPVTRLQDREKVPIPPPPSNEYWPRTPYCHLEDEILRPIHYYNFTKSTDTKFNVQHERLMKKVIKNNGAIRTKEVELTDIEYYQDDKPILSTLLSFRLSSVVQICPFEFPRIEDDGYFPPGKPDHEWYLFEKYLEANAECTETFSAVRPPTGRPIRAGFVNGVLHPYECLAFHMVGRHIHGFFNVWDEEGRGWQQSDGNWVPRRYLVDIYNHMMFPLYVGWEHWPATLKWAFDKYSLYGLKLMYMVKRHSRELKNAGESLFSPYPSHLQPSKSMKYDLTSVKGRNQFLSSIQTENNHVVDRFMDFPSNPHRTIAEEDATKKKRRGRKSDEATMPPVMVASPPKSYQRTPRKALEPPQNFRAGAAPNQRVPNVQKENLERVVFASPPMATKPTAAALVMTSPPVPQVPQALQPPQQPAVPIKPPPVPPKRRHTNDEEENGIVRTPPSLPPRKKSRTVDSWDEHRYRNTADEEHVDDEKAEKEDSDDSDSKNGVWVPRDRGEEALPEDYAREILNHYIGPRENAATSPQLPPLPVPKQRRRKSNPKATEEPFMPNKPELVVPFQPATSSSPFSSPITSPITSPTIPSTVSPATVAALSALSSSTNKSASLPAPPGTTMKLKFSRKHPVYPVKTTLNTPSKPSPPVVMNGTRHPTAPMPSRTPPIGSKRPYATQQKAPSYFTTSQRSRVSAQYTSPSTAPASAPPPPPPPSSLPPVPPPQHQINGTNNLSTPSKRPPSPSPPTHNPAYRSPLPVHEHPPLDPAVSPETRAIPHQKNLLLPHDMCRRGMPFNIQMEYKQRTYEPPVSKASSPPPNIPTKQIGPYVTTTRPTGYPAPPVPVDHRTPPRGSYSTGVPLPPHRLHNHIPPIAAPTMAHHHLSSATSSSSNATERSVGLINKSRHVSPSLANSRAMVEMRAVASVVVDGRSERSMTGPIRATTSSMMASTPTAIPGTRPMMNMRTSGTPETTTGNSLRSFTSHLRKQNGGVLTPEQIGNAIRNETQRFQEDNNGAEGPSVKSFLMNLKN